MNSQPLEYLKIRTILHIVVENGMLVAILVKQPLRVGYPYMARKSQ